MAHPLFEQINTDNFEGAAARVIDADGAVAADKLLTAANTSRQIVVINGSDTAGKEIEFTLPAEAAGASVTIKKRSANSPAEYKKAKTATTPGALQIILKPATGERINGYVLGDSETTKVDAANNVRLQSRYQDSDFDLILESNGSVWVVASYLGYLARIAA